MQQQVGVGRIGGAYGVHGWVKVFSSTEPPTALLDWQPWLLLQNGAWSSFEVAEGKPHGKGLIARLQGVEDRERAALLVNAEIAVTRNHLPALTGDEYYWIDLIGLRVRTIEGRELGRVDHLFETGANDVLVVQGDKERLIPFVRPEVVRTIDLIDGYLLVDWDPDF